MPEVTWPRAETSQKKKELVLEMLVFQAFIETRSFFLCVCVWQSQDEGSDSGDLKTLRTLSLFVLFSFFQLCTQSSGGTGRINNHFCQNYSI